MERSGSLPPVSMAVYGELGSIQYQWHHLEQAHQHFQRAIQVSTLTGYTDAELYYRVILSRLFQIQGDLETAAWEIQKAVDMMRVEAPRVVGKKSPNRFASIWPRIISPPPRRPSKTRVSPSRADFPSPISNPG
jgi:hypothetical protein